MTTYRSLMSAAHQTARTLRQTGEYATYREAFAVALRAAWMALREAEATPKAQPRPEVWVVSGNTYAHRGELRSAGFGFDAARKVWTIGRQAGNDLPKKVRFLKGLEWRLEVAA